MADGKILRTTEVSMQEAVDAKLNHGNPKLAIHKAQIDIYNTKTQEVVDRKTLSYDDAIAFGKASKLEFPELGYRVIQIVE